MSQREPRYIWFMEDEYELFDTFAGMEEFRAQRTAEGLMTGHYYRLSKFMRHVAGGFVTRSGDE